MKTKSLYIFFSAIFLFLSGFAKAQSSGDWLENTMYASGKINVVVAVVAVVFVLLLVYLFAIDRRLKRLEDKQKNNLS